MQTEWMNDPALKEIDRQKLEFLQALVFESSHLKKEQLLPFLMNIAKRGQANNISFTDEEIEAIIQVLQKNATPQEIAKMEKILAMRSRQK